MNLLKKLLERRSSAMNISDSAFSAFYGAGSSYVNSDRAAQHVVIHRCVQLIAETLSMVPCRLYRIADNNGRESAQEHPLYNVLQDQFNPGLTAFEGREWLIASLMVNGNAYAKKEYNNAGQVIGLYPIAPNRVMVERLPSGRIRYSLQNLNGTTEILLQEEMLHIRYRTKDGYLGISPIQHAMPHVGLSMDQLEQVADQTKNGFRAPGALVSPNNLTDTNRTHIREAFKNQFTGFMKAGVPMLLDGGFKWESFNIPAKDAEFLESRKLSNLDLCRIYGVPPSAVGITDNATYSNIGEESRALVQRCIAPMAARAEQAMNMALLTPENRKTLFIEHDLQGLLRGDLSARYAAYKTGREAGFLSANEIRKFENMPKIEGGDEYLSPLNMTLAGNRAESTAQNAN